MSETEAKYSVELFKEGGEGAGQPARQPDRCPGDLSRPCRAVSGAAGHAVRPGPRSGEKRPTRDDALTLWRNLFVVNWHGVRTPIGTLRC